MVASGLNKGPSIGTRRRFIEVPKSLPTTDLGLDVLLLTSQLTETELHLLIEDGISSAGLKGSEIPTSTRQISWSPSPEDGRFHSILTILSTAGCLSLYQKRGLEWECSIDVSQMWKSLQKETWKNLEQTKTSGSVLFAAIKKRAQRVNITVSTWSESYKNRALLFTGTFDGSLMVWNVDLISAKVELLCKLEGYFSSSITSLVFLESIQSKEEDLALHKKGYVFMATKDGQLYGINFNESSPIQDTDIFNLWAEQDRIEVLPGGLQATLLNKKPLLAVAKGSRLLILYVEENLTLISKGLFNTSDVTITGLCFMKDMSVIVASWSRSVYIAKIEVSEKSMWLSVTTVPIPQKNEHFALVGLSISRSECMAALAYTVIGPFDHLVLRDRSLVVLCSLKDAKKTVFHSDGPLRQIWDALEILRVESAKKVTTIELYNIDQMDVMGISDLKKNLWFVLMLSHLESTTESYREEINRLREELTGLIVSHHVFKRVSRILSGEGKTTNSFTLASLAAMKRWLSVFIDKLSTTNYVATLEIAKTLLEQTESYGDLKEICPICNGSVSQFGNDEKFMTCDSGHTIPRCTVSLAPCIAVPYYYCCRCSVVAHPIPVEEDGDNVCLFCDGFFQCDKRIITGVPRRT